MIEPLLLPLLAKLRRELSRLIFLGLLCAYGLTALAVCGGEACDAGVRVTFLVILDQMRPYLWQGMVIAYLAEFSGGILAMTIGLAWDWWKERPQKAAAKAVAEATKQERAAAQEKLREVQKAAAETARQERAAAEAATEAAAETAKRERAAAETAKRERAAAEAAAETARQERAAAEAARQESAAAQAELQAQLRAKDAELQAQLRAKDMEILARETEMRARELELRGQQLELLAQENARREQNLTTRDEAFAFREMLLRNGIDPDTGDPLPNFHNGNGNSPEAGGKP